MTTIPCPMSVWACPATGEAGGETACPMPRASRRWREKDLDSVVARARQYAEEALAWLTREGHVSSLSVSVERVQPGHLGISVAVQPSGSDDPGREWRFIYDYQQAQPVSVRLEA